MSKKEEERKPAKPYELVAKLLAPKEKKAEEKPA